MSDHPAAEFIARLLGPITDSYTFQIFQDNKAHPVQPAHCCGTFAATLPFLERANAGRAGIFITINHTRGSGRSAVDVDAVRCLMVDGDDLAQPDFFAVTPTLLQCRENSDRRWQAFWRLKPGEDIARWTAAQKALIRHYGSDSHIHDLPRVMRLPGFTHWKSPQRPTRYVIRETGASIYTIDEVLRGHGIDPATVVAEAIAPRRTRAKAEAYGDHPADVEACRNRLAEFEPAVEGAGGDNQTFRACCLGRDHNLSPEAFRPLLQEWSERCIPPWGADELEQKLRNGYSFAKATVPGQAAPSAAFSPIPPGGPVEPEAPPLAPAAAAAQVAELIPWRDRALKNKDGSWKSHVRNVQLIFENDPQVSQCIQFNEFTSTIEVGRAPWRTWRAKGEWADDDDTAAACWIGETYGAAVGSDVVHAAVRPYARARRSYHPVRDYLRALTWDGRPRLDTWTVRYLGAEDTPHHRAVGARFLIGAVARILHPGCQMDTMLVLEGEQGTGKSRAARTLFGEWFNDAMIDISHKDAALVIRGKWGVEFGEMHAVSRAEQTQIKAYLSRRADRQRDSHDRCVSEHDRQCVFIGTTNQQFYQMDSTGGRRFWPVACARIDLGRLERDRDQLWAEALTRQEAGEPHHLTAGEEAATQAEQGLRHLRDDWIERIETWLAAHADFGVSASAGVTGLEVWVGALAGEVKHIRRADQVRIAECMRQIGFKPSAFRRGSTVLRGYVRVTTVTPAQL